ncbi:MAG: glycosyltransferase family 2 protein [Enterococcus italicus]|uniref:glycosyltransferase family 2 protein n=1 Tax=Enterococcus italicus TaxID=246144 RepID=UPI00399216FA
MVYILLSTFNGEKYLRKLLDSLLNQAYKDFQIIIRDDGSKDGTLKILGEYNNIYNNIDVYFSDNVGVKKSFFELITMVIKNYPPGTYFFCDQDDYWLPNKVEMALAKMNLANSGPVLYLSTLNIVDEKLEIIERTQKFDVCPNSCIFENISTGCTNAINYDLAKLIVRNLPKVSEIEMHDSWIYMVGCFFGVVIYDSNSYIFYRQHSSNQVGMRKNNLYSDLLSILSEIKRKKHRKQTLEFINIFYQQLDDSKKTMLDEYKKNQINRTHIIKRFNYFTKYSIESQSKVRRIGYRLAYSLNLI